MFSLLTKWLAGRMKKLRGPPLARGPLFGDPWCTLRKCSQRWGNTCSDVGMKRIFIPIVIRCVRLQFDEKCLFAVLFAFAHTEIFWTCNLSDTGWDSINKSHLPTQVSCACTTVDLIDCYEDRVSKHADQRWRITGHLHWVVVDGSVVTSVPVEDELPVVEATNALFLFHNS